MAVRSKALYTGIITTTLAATLYTVPTGFRTIVRSIVITDGSGAAGNVLLELFTGSTRIAFISAHVAAFPADGSTVYLTPWIVMMQGITLKVTLDHQPASLVVSGAELAL